MPGLNRVIIITYSIGVMGVHEMNNLTNGLSAIIFYLCLFSPFF